MKSQFTDGKTQISAIGRFLFPGPVLPILAFIFMSWISWQKWAHIIIDYGLQVYVPWALSEGQVLYRDLHYLYGPLSVYVHSLLFRITGPGILYLAIFNIILIALTSICIFRLIRRLSDSETATLATTVFVGVFAFAYTGGWGLMNFVCPYSYELPHGIMLSLLALYQFIRYTDQPSPTRIVGIGVLLGLVYLTKPEVFLAAALALITGWTILIYFEAETQKSKVLKLGLLLVSFLLPIFLFVFYFALHMPLTEALRAIVIPWIHVSNPEVRGLPIYKFLMGTLFLQHNLTKIAIYLSVFTMFLAGLFYLNKFLTRTGNNSPRSAFYISAIVICLGIILSPYIPWLDFPLPFPLILAGYGIFKIIDFVKHRGDPFWIMQNLPIFVFALFSFLLTFKAILNLNSAHTLALPATLILLVIFLFYLPKYIESLSGTELTFRSALFSLSGLVVLILMLNSNSGYLLKRFPVGEGLDKIYDLAPATRYAATGRYITRGMFTKSVLNYFDKNIEKDATLAVFPDMIIYNYLTRRKAPTEHVLFHPTWMMLFGETPMLNGLKKTPPPYIMFVNIDYSVHGAPFFGKDYGNSIFEWIRTNYSVIKQFGPTPFTGQEFGVQIWKKQGDPKNPT